MPYLIWCWNYEENNTFPIITVLFIVFSRHYITKMTEHRRPWNSLLVVSSFNFKINQSKLMYPREISMETINTCDAQATDYINTVRGSYSVIKTFHHTHGGSYHSQLKIMEEDHQLLASQWRRWFVVDVGRLANTSLSVWQTAVWLRLQQTQSVCLTIDLVVCHTSGQLR